MIQVIHRSFNIIEFVARDPDRPKLLSEIAIGLNLKPGTCANIVKTLTTRGYLEKLGSQKGYLLGKQFYTLAGNTGYWRDLVAASNAEMEKLSTLLMQMLRLLTVIACGSKRFPRGRCVVLAACLQRPVTF